MNLFQRYLADEFAEDYSEGRISRREALKLIASVTGSLLMANSILSACIPQTEEAAPGMTPAASITTAAPTASEVPTAESAATESLTSANSAYGTVMPDDPAVVAGEVQISASDTTIMGYLARPSNATVSPVILVCHENRGLTPHIQDVARRYAKAGYVGLAVDLLSRQGGSAAVGEANVPGALGNIPPEQFVEDFKSGWRYLQGQSFADANRVGMNGFCFGGGVTWQVAAHMPELLAAVPFYGRILIHLMFRTSAPQSWRSTLEMTTVSMQVSQPSKRQCGRTTRSMKRLSIPTQIMPSTTTPAPAITPMRHGMPGGKRWPGSSSTSAMPDFATNTCSLRINQ